MNETGLSRHHVSHGKIPYTYYRGMANGDKAWKTWGARFRDQMRAKELNLAVLADRMSLAESTLRSWTNGNRDINLSDFFRLCAAAGIDPHDVLFPSYPSAHKVNPTDEKRSILDRAWELATPTWREQLTVTAEAIIKSRGAARSR